ncbi:MAG: hypothetical protein K9L61_04390 [Candidatus Omnitrophica bacterium]|nr:hypothetical protein [Candidatus Omnitrophota bacterium]
MVKNALKIILVSIIALSSLSCKPNTPSTYSRKNIEQIIQTLCQEEFQIKVKAWLIGETLWVYVPFGNIVDQAGQPTADFTKNTRRIFLTLRRAFLNMDNPPKFYSFVLSDVEDQGFDLYRIGFVRDFIKFQMGLISLKQINQRVVVLSAKNKQALGDSEGKHIRPYNITIGDFIGYLVRQRLNNAFILYPEQVEVKNIQSYYQQKKLGIIFDIEIKKREKDVPEPFSKAKEIIKQYLEIYNRPAEIVEIEVTDSSSKKSSIFTQAALFD